MANGTKTVLRREWFERRMAKNLGKEIETVKPIARFPEGGVELGFNVGTRTNGVDRPRWPRDLGVEIVEDDN